MLKNHTRKLVVSALMAALTCVFTMMFPIPSLVSKGYVNFGDCFVLLSGFVLGPLYGGLSAGIGSMLADMFLGYSYYMPATFLIKLSVAIVAFCLYKSLKKPFGRFTYLARIISAVIAELVMACGYFVYEAWVLGFGLASLGSVPGNLIQGAFGVISSVLLIEILGKTKIIKL